MRVLACSQQCILSLLLRSRDYCGSFSQSFYVDRSALQATLLVRHPVSDRIVVNFDPEAMKLIKEAKALSRLGINIPEAAKMVVLQEEKFISASERLEFALEEFSRVSAKVYPLLKPLLQPFVEAVDNCLHPGLSFLTWQSMNIDNFLLYLHKMIKTVRHYSPLKNLVLAINVSLTLASLTSFLNSLTTSYQR